MSEWEEDISAWVKGWFKKVTPGQIARTQAVAVKKRGKREGWDPKEYNSTMREELHRWLDDWYTLSVKDMSEPATLRKNPIEDPLHLLYKQILKGNR